MRAVDPEYTKLLLLAAPSTVGLILFVIHGFRNRKRPVMAVFLTTAALFGVLRGNVIHWLTTQSAAAIGVDNVFGLMPYLMSAPLVHFGQASLQEVFGWIFALYLGWVLAEAGLDPTVVIGGQVNSLGSNAKLGEGEFLVAEADESDGSILHLSPVVEVVTNIDLEHVDFYKDLDEIKEVFLQFINKIPFYGAAVLCLEDEQVADLLPRIKKRVITYGLTRQADINARDINAAGFNSSFTVWRGDRELGVVTLPAPGRHNILNSLAAMGVALELEIDFAVIARALASFTGVKRRLEIKGEKNGITVIDDYGHHPTEIRATLAALRTTWPDRRLVVLFQPHRYSRTRGLFKEFCTAFHRADLLFMTDIYPASEQPIPGVTTEKLLGAIRERGQRRIYYVPEVTELPSVVAPYLGADDIVLTLGAGSIWRAGEQLLEEMGK